MVFSSAIFLYVFFPVVFLLYRIVPGMKCKNWLLIVTSLVFYSFGQPRYIVLLLLSVGVNYLAGRLLCSGPCVRAVHGTRNVECGAHDAAHDAEHGVRGAAGADPASGGVGRSACRLDSIVTMVAVVINIGILAVFKYLDFALENINTVCHTCIPMSGIVLPIGISFYTFQGLSYVVDVYRNRSMATKSFTKLLLYISFFPQLIAGPIVKYHDVAQMIDSRKTSPGLTANGLRRFIIGLSKKLLIANAAGVVADRVFSLDAGSLDMRIAWLGAICYTLQIYFDFSGYSDMAIGMGRIFGFRFLENFNYPYISTSIREFWRRWHISLSSWFRDYLYIPLGGSYCSRTRANLNRLIVFFTTGLWHGANWTFVLWGLWHGMFLIFENSGIIPVKKLRTRRAGRAVGHIYTLLVVVLGFTLFRADTMSDALTMFTAMFGGCTFTSESSQLLHELLTHSNLFWILAGILLSIDWLPHIRRFFGILDDRIVDDGPGITRSMQDGNYEERRSGRIVSALSYVAAFVLLIYCMLDLSQSAFNPFIYFQF